MLDGDNELISLEQAAKEFGLRQDYLRLLIFRNRLRAKKIGRNWVTTKIWVAESRQTTNGHKGGRTQFAPMVIEPDRPQPYPKIEKILSVTLPEKESKRDETPQLPSQKAHAAKTSFRENSVTNASSLQNCETCKDKLYFEPARLRSIKSTKLGYRDHPLFLTAGVYKKITVVAVLAILLFLTVRLGDALENNFARTAKDGIARARQFSIRTQFQKLSHANIGNALGDFFISSATPPSPRSVVAGLKEDLLTIFTNASVPSGDSLFTALKGALDNVLALRPSFHISLPSFSTLFGLTSPSPVAVVPPQELQTPPPAAAPPAETPGANPPPAPAPATPPRAQPAPAAGAPALPPAPAPSAVTQIIEKKVVVSPADVSLFQKKLDALNAYINLQVASLLGNLNDLTVKVDAKTAFTVFAQSQKIDQLQSPAILSGMTISSGDLVSQGGFSFAGDGLVKGNLQVNKALSVNTTGSFTTGLSTGGDFSVAGNTTLVGSLTVNGGITVSGPETFSGAITIPYFTATSTTATSSVAYGFTAATQGGLVGIGTSSPFAKLSLAGLGTGPNTYSFAVSNAASTTNFVIQDNGSVGIGTTSPGSLLAVTGGLLATGDAHLFGPLTLPYFNATSSTATSTLATGGFTIGTNQFIVQETSGRIGIGTTTPDAMMSIRQTVNGTPFLSASRVTDTAPSGDFINFKTNAGSTLFRVDNSGNLLAGGIINSGSQTITSTSQPQFRVQYDASNEITTSVGSTGTTTIGVNGSAPSLSFTPQSNSVNTFNFTDALAANSILSIDTLNRRVGIGTANPLQKLDVRGNALLSGTLDVNGGTINFGSGSATSTLTSANGILTIPIASTTSFSIGNLLAVSGAGTSTYAGGISLGTTLGGLKVSQGIESTAGDLLLTGGKIVSTGVGTSTFSGGIQNTLGLKAASLESAGDTLVGGLLKVTSSGTSTYTGGVSAAGLAATTNGLRVTGGDTVLSGGLQVAGGSNFTGNVGIGTASPGRLLTLQPSTGDAYINLSRPAIANQSTLEFSTGATDDWLIRTITNSDLNIYSFGTGTNVLTILRASGNVGIGTTGPNGKFEVVAGANGANAPGDAPTAGSITDVNHTFAANVATLYLQSNSTMGVDLGGTLGFAGRYTGSSDAIFGMIAGRKENATDNNVAGYLAFATRPAGGNNTEAMRITSSGNVGIGTTGPATKLDVNGDIFVEGGNAIYFRTNTSGNYISSPATSQLNIVTGGTERVRIDNNGNVGIGTTSPAEKLSVAGNIIATGCLHYNVNTTSGTCVDIAESYPAGEDLAPAYIVSAKPDGSSSEGFSVVKATSASRMLGVVSTRPAVYLQGDNALFGGSSFTASSTFQAGSSVPLALAGRVPVAVNLDGGPIAVGDRITLSSVPGVGTKATSSGETIGIALEAFDGSTAMTTSVLPDGTMVKEGKILVFLNLGYSKLDDTAVSLASASTTSGTSLAAPSVPWTIDPYSGKVNVDFAGDINLKGNAILDVGRISGMWGRWSIDENGVIVASKIVADTLTAKDKLCVGTTCVTEAQLKELLEKNAMSATPAAPPSPPPDLQPAPASATVPPDAASTTPAASDVGNATTSPNTENVASSTASEATASTSPAAP